jgi:hypothetical protein
VQEGLEVLHLGTVAAGTKGPKTRVKSTRKVLRWHCGDDAPGLGAGTEADRARERLMGYGDQKSGEQEGCNQAEIEKGRQS